MADFCNKCVKEVFGENATPDIDVPRIANNLALGHMSIVLCEGCSMGAIIKEGDGSVKLLFLPAEADEVSTYESLEAWQSSI